MLNILAHHILLLKKAGQFLRTSYVLETLLSILYIYLICLHYLSDFSYFVVCAKLLQSCLTLCDPMDCGPPGSFVHGILQARILEWVAMPFFGGSFQSRKNWTHVSYIFYNLFFALTKNSVDFGPQALTREWGHDVYTRWQWLHPLPLLLTLSLRHNQESSLKIFIARAVWQHNLLLTA